IAIVAGAGQGGDLPAGSAPYMSPEQVRGEALDLRSDLFATGAVLWELLTGRPLFARATVEATLEAVLAGDVPPPSRVAAEVPRDLDRVCLRALAPRREDRFASAGQMQAALGRYLYAQDPPPTAAALSALIARACPSAMGAGAGPSRRPGPVPGTDDVDRTRPSPDRGPRGLARAPTVETFATSVQLARVLAAGTPGSNDQAAAHPSEPAATPRSASPRRR